MKILPARLPVFLLASMMATAATAAGTAADSARGLADLSLEELMNESITSVGKKQQPMSQAAAAIYVLTAEDIRRAGHTSIPEALRMVPGLSVARLDSHTWVISARGFAAQWAGKLLVLVDGRTVYDPFFSGVVWSLQDLMLEDLDRIEVIRGPGATLWGANAVNGVINVITKKASDTQGGLVMAGGGTEGNTGGLRYGRQLNETASYRAYAKYDDGAAFILPDGQDAPDSWLMRRAGFRADWQASEKERLTLQGDVYSGTQEIMSTLTSLTPPYVSASPYPQEVSGANLLGHWSYTRDGASTFSVQAYVDRSETQTPMISIRGDVFDLEVQHQLEFGSRHAIVYGAGYRLARAEYEDSFFLTYPVDQDSHGVANAFFQDDITLRAYRLSLTVGSKFEHNEMTGLEVQPSARLLWTPTASQSAWASVSRAVRTPNRLESDLRINYAVFDVDTTGPMPPSVLAILPNPDLESEELVAYEIGYRAQPRESVYLDFAAYVNVYDRLIDSADAGAIFETNPAPAHVVIASRPVNAARGEAYGIEFGPSWQVTDSWRLAGAYTWVQMQLHSDATAFGPEAQAGDSPRHQFHLRSFKQWPNKLSFDTAIYYVDELPNQQISSYVRVDARLGWQPTDSLEVSLAGTNLLDSRHSEFVSFAVEPIAVRRSVYGKLTWRF